MKLIDSIYGEKEFDVGDVIKIVGLDSYLVTHEDRGYTLRNLDGYTKFCDTYDSLSQLVSFLKENQKFNYVVYSHIDYGIQLISLKER